MQQSQLFLKFCLLGILSTSGLLQLASLQSNAANQSTAQYEDSIDLSSLAAKSNSARTTELGKIGAQKNDPQQEIDILLKDPAMAQKWGLVMTQSQKAWQVSKGSKEIIVAIIDTGADIQHPDLKANLWVNKGEIPNNKKDDDQNGYVDDVHGWNFVANNNDLTDNHGHGTHITGIIGAKSTSARGVNGVAPQVSLMILKYYDPKSPGINNLSNTVRAIEYATKLGAHIINYSGGGLEPSEPEKLAVKRAQEKGILFVAAAGNEKSNSDEKAYYPADYDLSNIISVTAVDKSKNVLPSSNWGVRSVDIAAPGNDIYSTLPGGMYGTMTGTSQATAFVSGVAALVMAQNSQLRKADEIIKYLTKTGDIDERLEGKTRYSRRLNSYRALAIQDADLSFAGTKIAGSQAVTKFKSEADGNTASADSGAPIADQFLTGARDILGFIEKFPSSNKSTSAPLSNDTAEDTNL